MTRLTNKRPKSCSYTLIAIFLIFYSLVGYAGRLEPSVKINYIQKNGSTSKVGVTVNNFSSDNYLLLIYKFKNNGFGVPGYDKVLLRARDKPNKKLHIFESKILVPTGRIAKKARWEISYDSYRNESEIYVVLFKLRSDKYRSGWSPEKDYKSIKYLGFEKLSKFGQVLNKLDRFGWKPIRYTRKAIN